MEAKHNHNNDASGYLTDAYEGLGAEFTDVEELSRSECFVVARAKRYGRWWVLKGLLPEYAAHESHQQMLRKEFEVMMQLQHPLVVQATGLEQVAGLGQCIVMEYVDGIRLGDWLRQHPGIAARRRLARCLLEAVNHVHINGIVHRDLKPSNILVTGNGSGIKLIDFGLADTVSHAVLKQPAGTANYMSPEQMEQFTPDVRNDIYSLGIVMREMALGRRYRKVIARCLAPIGSRYGTVGDLQNALSAADAARRRWLRAAIALGALLLVGAVAWLTSTRLRPVAIAATDDGAADTLRAELAVQQAMQRALSDSIALLAADNQRLQDIIDQQQQQREQEQQRQLDGARQHVGQAIVQGRRAVDAAAARSGIVAHLDTLSNAANLDERLFARSVGAIRQAAYDYMVSIKRDFTPDELESIRKDVEAYVNATQHKWLAKINAPHSKRRP